MYSKESKFMGAPLPRDKNPPQSQHKDASIGIMLLP